MNALVGALLFQAAAAAPEAAQETRPVVVQVREASKVPVKGARVIVEPAVPAEMALAELLAKRAGVSREDGLLDLGALPLDQPIALRIAAAGYRTGTLKLPAGFEAGRRTVVLVPNQDVEVRVTGLAGRKGEARAEVWLARRKDRWPESSAVKQTVRQHLDDEGRTRFRRIEGGSYEAELRVPGLGSTREAVDVARDGDVPTLVVDMAVGEWTFRGTTQLHEGKAVPARVTAVEIVRGLGEGTAAETQSAADGAFELKLVSKAGHKVLLKAESEDPRAVSASMSPVPLDAGRPVLEDVVIELDATALEIAVRDARSNDPLAGCPVHIDWGREESSPLRASQRTTDADGIAREYAMSGGTVRARVACKGHYSKDLAVVAVARDETTRVDVVLEPSQDLVLAAVDEGGRAVAEASIFVLAAPLSVRSSSARWGGDSFAGLTDDAGELLLRGESYGGRLAFVVAAGHTLGMRVLPEPGSCERREDCRLVVIVGAPRPWGVVVVRRESGDPVSLRDVTLRRGGLPIPFSILTALLFSNGLFVDESASPLELRVAALLPDGLYSASVQRPRITPETSRDVKSVEVPIGSFSIPSLGRVELVDRDGVSPKPANSKAPRVAER